MRYLISAVVLFSVPASGLDLAARALDYGTNEYGMAASYLHVADTDDHSLELEVRGGRMMGAGMELELEGSLQRLWDDDLCTGVIGLTGSFVYNIRTYASWVPFFLGGGGLRYDRVSYHDNVDSETDALIQFGLGVRFFFTESAALRVDYRFQSRLADPESVNSHRILAGISVFPG